MPLLHIKWRKGYKRTFHFIPAKTEQVDRSCCLLRKYGGSKDAEVCWVMWLLSNYRVGQEDYSSLAHDSMQPHLFLALGDDNAFSTASPKPSCFKGHSAFPTYPFTWRDPSRSVWHLTVIKGNGREKRFSMVIFKVFGKRTMNLETAEVWSKPQTGRCSWTVFSWHLCTLASSEEITTISPWDLTASSMRCLCFVGTNFVLFFLHYLLFLCLLPPKDKWNTEDIVLFGIISTLINSHSGPTFEKS